jgi:trimethylamine--corrinoid protein Co-methyltransferase
LAALSGSNMICESAGMLGSLLGCSLEAMVLDNDLIGAVQRSLRGIEVNDETLSFDVIEQTVLGPSHFLGSPQTLALMQTEYLYPKIADRSSVAEWEYRGSPDVLASAGVRVKQILAQHYPQYIAPERDAALRAQYDLRLPAEMMRAGNARWPA